jgi:hypothetical protein
MPSNSAPLTLVDLPRQKIHYASACKHPESPEGMQVPRTALMSGGEAGGWGNGAGVSLITLGPFATFGFCTMCLLYIFQKNKIHI